MATQTRTMADISRYANKTIRLSAFLAETEMPLFIDKLATQGSDSPSLSLMEALDKDINVTAEYLKDMSKILQTVNSEHRAPELEMEQDDMRVLFPDAYNSTSQTLSLFGLTLRKGRDYDLSRMENKFVRETLFNGVFPKSNYADFKNLLTHLRKLDKAPTPSIKSPLTERIAYMTTKAATSHMDGFKRDVLKLLEGYQNIRRSMDIKSQQMVDDRFYGGRAMLYGVTKASTYISKEDGILQVGSRHKKHPQAIESIHSLVKSLPFIRAVEIDQSSDIRKFRDMMRDLENMKLDCPRAFELKDRKLGNYRFSGAYATRSDQLTFERGVTIPDMEIIAYDQDSPASIAHEIAHFMDPREGNEMRNRIVAHFYNKIDQDIFEEMGIGNTDYFLSDAEIFARLGEIGFLLNQYGIQPGETPAMLTKRVAGEEEASPLRVQHRETFSLIRQIESLNRSQDDVERMSQIIHAVGTVSDDDITLPPADAIERQSQAMNQDTLRQWISLGEKLHALGYEEHDDASDILRKAQSPQAKQEVGLGNDPLHTLSLPQRRHNLEQVADMHSLPGALSEVDIDTYLKAGLESGAFTQAQVDAHNDREFAVSLTKPIETYMGQTSRLNQAIYFDMANWSSEEMALVANYTHNMYFTPDPFADDRAQRILNSRALRNVTWNEHQKKNMEMRRSTRRTSDDTLLAQAIGRIPTELLGEAYTIGAKEHLLADGEFTAAVLKRWTRLGRGGAKKLPNSVPLNVIEKQYQALSDLVKATVSVNAPADFALMQQMFNNLGHRAAIDVPEALEATAISRQTVATHLSNQIEHAVRHYRVEVDEIAQPMSLPGAYSFKLGKDDVRYQGIATALQDGIKVASNSAVPMDGEHPMPSTTMTGQIMLAADLLVDKATSLESFPEMPGDYATEYMSQARAEAIIEGNIDLTGIIDISKLGSLLPVGASTTMVLSEMESFPSRVEELLNTLSLDSKTLKSLGETITKRVEDQRARSAPGFSTAFTRPKNLDSIKSIVAFLGEYANSPAINGRRQDEMGYQELREHMPLRSSLMYREKVGEAEVVELPLSLVAHSLRETIGEAKAGPALKELVGGIMEDATPEVIALVNKAVDDFSDIRGERQTGVTISGTVLADPTTRMIENLFIESRDDNILEHQPKEALIDATIKATVAAAVHAVTSKTPVLGAARSYMTRDSIPGHDKKRPILFLQGQSAESMVEGHSHALAAVVKHYINTPEPDVAKDLMMSHYGRGEASKLVEAHSAQFMADISDKLMEVAPEVVGPAMQAMALTASQTDYLSFEKNKEALRRANPRIDAHSRLEQDAVRHIEMLSQYLQLPAVMAGAKFGPEFLSLPEPENSEALALTVDATVSPDASPDKPNRETSPAPTTKPERAAPEPDVDPYKPDNNDIPSAGDDPLSARNQMRLC